jgi:opacity protein-like surface antigen
MRFGVLLLFASNAAAQSVGVGVKGGVPLNDVLESSRTFGGQTFKANTNRFTVGPMLDIRLPFGFGVEFDALYKRFDQTGDSINGGTVAKTGTSWEFPLLGKFRFGHSFAKPYVEAGVSFNHLGGYLLPFRTPISQQPEGSTARTGLTVGAGVELKFSALRLSPGIRFSHWGSETFVPSTNAADFLIGLTF